MSLNKTIDRLARVVRLEARRNPEFAERLEAALAAHQTRRPASQDALAAVDAPEPGPAPEALTLNPVAVAAQSGPEALRAALEGPAWSTGALRALAREHNLDPAGEAAALEGAALVAHLVNQAQRRVERDRRMFDY